jgi:non-ribosomal peptide synthetase component F
VADGSGSIVHTPIGFDLTVTSLFSPLIVGQRLALLAEDKGVEGLSRMLLGGDDFSLIKITPAHLHILNELLPEGQISGRVHRLVIGGEALHSDSLTPWYAHSPDTRLTNEYGPTETVVGC